MFPEIRLSDSVSISTYLVYLSFLFCGLLVYVLKRSRKRGLSSTQALDLSLILMIFGFLGGRLVHVFYESPSHYFEDWTRILKFWEGGFVFYGGFLSALAAAVLYAWKKHLQIPRWLDFFAPVLALGYGLGRVSCFLAGCCYGRSCDLPWGLTLTWDTMHVLRHPVQLYAVAWESTLFAFLVLWERKIIFRSLSRPAGQLFALWLNLHSLGRLMMEYFRDDFRGALILGISVSSFLSLILLTISLISLSFLSRSNR
jgi:phosphatidylglycerol:prolipoprotein diacylglycerol transferase